MVLSSRLRSGLSALSQQSVGSFNQGFSGGRIGPNGGLTFGQTATSRAAAAAPQNVPTSQAGSSAAALNGTVPTYNIYGSGSSDPTSVIGGATQVSTQSTNFSFPTDLPLVHFMIVQGTAGGNPTVSQFQYVRTFRLPIPLELKDPFEVQFDPNFSYMGSLTQAASSVSATAANAVAALANAGQAVGAGINVYVNAFKSVTMSQPAFRTISFNWKLSPKNQQEAYAIRQIAYLLRKGMTPKRIGTTGGMLIGFPDIFFCGFSPNPHWLFKFKPAVLQSLVVDFNGGNPAPAFFWNDQFFSELPAESLFLTANFLELEYWLDGATSDYKDGDFPSTNPWDASNWFSINGIPGSGPSVIGPAPGAGTNSPLGLGVPQRPGSPPSNNPNAAPTP